MVEHPDVAPVQSAVLQVPGAGHLPRIDTSPPRLSSLRPALTSRAYLSHLMRRTPNHCPRPHLAHLFSRRPRPQAHHSLPHHDRHTAIPPRLQSPPYKYLGPPLSLRRHHRTGLRLSSARRKASTQQLPGQKGRMRMRFMCGARMHSSRRPVSRAMGSRRVSSVPVPAWVAAAQVRSVLCKPSEMRQRRRASLPRRRSNCCRAWTGTHTTCQSTVAGAD